MYGTQERQVVFSLYLTHKAGLMRQGNHPTPVLTKESMLGLTVMALFLVMHNIGAIFYQIRGVSSEHVRFSVFGYFLGITLAALSQPAFEQRLHESVGWRRGMWLFLLFPALFSFCAPLVMPGAFTGTLLFNVVQPLFWAALLPVSFRLFFLHVPAHMQPLFLGAAVGLGHLCWALIVPMVGAAAPMLNNPSFAAGERYLFFLNGIRVVFCLAFAVVAWGLLTKNCSGVKPAVPLCPENADNPGKTWAMRRLWFFLVPLLVCYFLNGLMNYLFSARLLTRGMYPEFMHLLLTVFFPVLGLSLYRSKEALLHGLLVASVLLFSATPLLLFFPMNSPAYQAVYLVCSVSHQTMVIAGTLVCGRFAPYSSMPALVASAAWLGTAAVIPGGLFVLRVQPLLPFPLWVTVCVCALLCLVSVPLLRQAFPLPPPDPAFEKSIAFMAQPPGVALPLNTREMDMLARAARGHSNAAIAQDMGLALSTVGNTMSRVYAKLAVKNRTQAIQKWNKAQP